MTDTHRRKHWIFWAVLLLAAAGWYLWYREQPRTLREVARWRLEDNLLTLTPQGVLHAELGEYPRYPLTFTQLDWQGNRRWQASLEMGGHVWLFNGFERYALSPDGHVLAVVKNAGPYLAVHSWHDGVKLGEARISLTRKPELGQGRLAVTNAGEVWMLPYWEAMPADRHQLPPIYVVKGARVLASTSFRTQTAIQRARGYRQTISPDGSFLSVQVYTRSRIVYECAGLRVQGKRIVFTRWPVIKPRSYAGAIQLPGGYLLTGEGNIYDAWHPAGITTGWGLLRYHLPSPAHQAVIQASSHNTIRVLDVPTRKTWQLPVKRIGMIDSDGVDIAPSADGRFVAVYARNPLAKPKPVSPARRWLYQIPRIGARLKAEDEGGKLAVYERPGRLRAYRAINAPFPTTRMQLVADTMAVSNDGHQVLYVEFDRTGTMLELVWYRW